MESKTHSRTGRVLQGATLGMAVLVGGVVPATAAEPDFVVDLPAGTACGFDLRIEGEGGNTITRTFEDQNGNVVRVLETGTGSALTFTNLATGASFSTRSNGAVRNTELNADGSSTVTSMGHNVLILFPTDVPAGPSTTLYVGRFVYTADANGVFTLQQASGRSTDICAALSE